MAGTIQADSILDSAGTGAPNFPQGLTADDIEVAAGIRCDTISGENGTDPVAFPGGVTFPLLNESGGNVYSGTYTPTIANLANVAASSAAVCSYLVVGSIVIVMGSVAIDPTAAAPTATSFTMTLPVASDFAATTNCNGVFCAPNAATTSLPGGILAHVANNAAQFDFITNDTANRTHHFMFMYQII